ncbi:Corticosteroid-binding protein [Candida viswanathii]|uniref:Corticosteroid-binding protein n=1 Tax=Candida viswanathii TaxID=5486 RepID=A0A367YKK0_9ASCO|nr:Corticosteroid-binding protein [Candida viswanathii]
MTSRTTKVTIIGAGVSGLKAAETLLASGLFTADDVVILEAQDRVGGRLKTVPSKSTPGVQYDLGASWFHDSLANVVLDDLIKQDLLDIENDVYYDDKDLQAYSSTGKVPVVDGKLNRVLEDIEKFIELYFHDSLNTPDLSLDDIVAKFFEQRGKFLTAEQKEYCGRMMRYLELWFGISSDRISGKYAVMDHQGRNLLNKRGYLFLVKHLASRIPESSILLNQPVKRIVRDNKEGDKKVLVETANGLKVYSDYLIVTVPHSILALDPGSTNGLVWEPKLPQNMTDAFKSIHFGALGKVVFEFDHIFWNNDQDRFQIIADKLDSAVGLSEKLETLPAPFTYPAFAVNFSRVHKTTGGSLVILMQSPLTDYLEAHPEQAWAYYKPMLQQLAVDPTQTIPEPTAVIVTDWTTNPWIRGSYSAMYTGDDPSDLIIQLSGEFENCGIPEPYIRFAGEHTISDGAGCVHGAYSSGIREAKWIINDLSPEVVTL